MRTDTHADLASSLEIAAGADGDYYADAMARYFELCPASRDLLSHTDELMRGRMMEQVVSLLLDPDVESLELYFRFEVANHESYGAQPDMYTHLFQACREVAERDCGDAWTGAMDAAWSDQNDRLLALIERYSSAPGS